MGICTSFQDKQQDAASTSRASEKSRPMTPVKTVPISSVVTPISKENSTELDLYYKQSCLAAIDANLDVRNLNNEAISKSYLMADRGAYAVSQGTLLPEARCANERVPPRRRASASNINKVRSFACMLNDCE